MRPFLKWAGGKYRIREHLKQHLPQGSRLVEPFLGAGTVFVNFEYSSYLLADINPDLITLYQHLQGSGESFIQYCSTFFTPETNQKEAYCQYRDQFNKTDDSALKSALFLYMNRHGFNGLCRYNKKGKFNVPFGRNIKPYFPHKEMLHFYERSQSAEFICTDFEKIFEQAQAGDIIYCDPPYVPLSTTANFTNYSVGNFSFEQQERLAQLAEIATQKGAYILISNHATPFTKNIYKNAQIATFTVQRNISCNGLNREKAAELIAMYPPI